MLKPGSWGIFLPCQVLTGLEGAVVGQCGARKMLFKQHLQPVRSLALLEQELGLHSVEMEESPGPSAVPGARWAWHAATLLWDCGASPGMQAAGTFGNTCQGELVSAGRRGFNTKWQGIKWSYLHWNKIQLQLKSELQVQLSPCGSGPGPGAVTPPLIDTHGSVLKVILRDSSWFPG